MQGVVDYYAPDVTGGDFQHLVTIQPSDMMEIVFPIAPQVDHGNITILVTVISQVNH